MSSSLLNQIEKKLDYLSYEEQLLLIEQIIHRLQKSTVNKPSILEEQLLAMANDPEIKNELQKIEKEFAGTEADGLEGI